MRTAIANCFLMGPTAWSGAQDDASDENELVRLRNRLSVVRQALTTLTDLVGQPGFSKARTLKRGAELAREEADLEAKIAGITRRSARAAMLVESQTSLWASHTVDMNAAVSVRRSLGERFDSLPLEQRRTLVKTMLDVTVYPGRTSEQVDIKHPALPSLDAGAELGRISDRPRRLCLGWLSGTISGLVVHYQTLQRQDAEARRP